MDATRSTEDGVDATRSGWPAVHRSRRHPPGRMEHTEWMDHPPSRRPLTSTHRPPKVGPDLPPIRPSRWTPSRTRSEKPWTAATSARRSPPRRLRWEPGRTSFPGPSLSPLVGWPVALVLGSRWCFPLTQAQVKGKQPSPRPVVKGARARPVKGVVEGPADAAKVVKGRGEDSGGIAGWCLRQSPRVGGMRLSTTIPPAAQAAAVPRLVHRPPSMNATSAPDRMEPTAWMDHAPSTGCPAQADEGDTSLGGLHRVRGATGWSPPSARRRVMVSGLRECLGVAPRQHVPLRLEPLGYLYAEAVPLRCRRPLAGTAPARWPAGRPGGASAGYAPSRRTRPSAISASVQCASLIGFTRGEQPPGFPLTWAVVKGKQQVH